MPTVATVLLVEDDPAWAMLTREAFRDAAPEVVVEWCDTGGAALRRLARRPWPDVVLLDLNLPDMAGLDVLQSPAVRPGPDQPAVVVLTASCATADRMAVTRAGAQHREKPTSYTELRMLASEIAAGPVSSASPSPVRGSAEHVGREGLLRGPEQP